MKSYIVPVFKVEPLSLLEALFGLNSVPERTVYTRESDFSKLFDPQRNGWLGKQK